MSVSSVTVLCPNGRRTTIKVTPNTSILQIIEDACKKHNLDPDNYYLKHLRRALDVSSSVRYSGLPNNCQLEMLKCDVPRTNATVTVSLAAGDQRLVHDFPATTSLWDILQHHEGGGSAGVLLPPAGDGGEAVLVYSMRRIIGHDLRTTTLKALGLTSGKCMLRHSIQTSSSNTQAHVATPLTRPKPAQENQKEVVQQRFEKQPMMPQPQPVIPQPQPVIPQPVIPQPVIPQPVIPQPQPVVLQPQAEAGAEAEALPDVSGRASTGPRAWQGEGVCLAGPDLVSSSHSAIPDVVHSQDTPALADVVPESERAMDLPAPMDLIEGHDVTSTNSCEMEEVEASSSQPEIIKLGSHNAILFSLDDVPPSDLSSEDDTFFDLTVDEVKKLYADQQKQLKDLNSTPLMTKGMREMEESAKVLSALHQFPVTQLRIYFPDSHVIQASFKPLDTILQVKDFLRPMLTDPGVGFDLQLRHPHRVLAEGVTLVAADCVPNARVYLEGAVTLSQDTLAKKSSFAGAMNSLLRRKPVKANLGLHGGGHTLRDAQPSTSQAEPPHQKRTSINPRPSGATPKMPKWFKTGK